MPQLKIMVRMFLLLIIWHPAILILLWKKYCLFKSFGLCCENFNWEGSTFIQTLYRIKNYGRTLQNVSRYARLWTTAAQGIPTWDQRPVTAVLNEESIRQRMSSLRLTSKLLSYKNCVSIKFDDSNTCWNGILAFSHCDLLSLFV